jgi:hypothetical protein
MTTTTLNASRESLIERILDAAAAREPQVKIVEAIRFRDPATGRQYSPFGLPFGIKSDTLERVVIGYVRQFANGCTGGTVQPSLKAMQDDIAQKAQAKREDFRGHLEVMDDGQLESQADYWLG